MNILRCENVTKTYQLGQSEVKALDGLNLAIEKGKFTVIVGGIRIGKINSAPYAGRSGSAYFRENMDRGYGYFHLIGKTAFCFQKA